MDSRSGIVYISAVSRNAFNALLGTLSLVFATAGCAASSRPAIELDEYLKYKDQVVTTLRPNLLNYYPELPRGMRYQCLEGPPKYALFQTFNQMAAMGPVEVERRIEAGEKAKILDIVRFKGAAGVVFAEAELVKDGEECLIPLGDGLEYRLIFTDAELAEFNKIPQQERERIVSREIRPGMPARYVLYTLGVPNERIPGAIPGTETWTYIPQPNRMFYAEFENGILRNFRE